MKVLFVTIAWPSTGERNLYSDLMEEFSIRGHDVFVAATFKDEEKADPSLSVENGISVLRISSGKIRKAAHLQKALSLLSLGRKLQKGIDTFFKDVRFDLIICPTPPITLSGMIKRLKKEHNAYFYLLLKDIWPQGSVDHKVFSKYSLPWLFFRFHEIRIYRLAESIGCMSPMGVEYLLSKNPFLSRDNVEVCPNCIRPANFIESSRPDAIRIKYNIPEDVCVFIFSGNLGIGHGLDFLVKAIHSLSDYPKAFFVIGGSGTHFRFLTDKVSELSLENVFLYRWMPAEDFRQILATSDVGLILLYRYSVPQFPSRLLSYLEYSKPVLCAVNKATDIGTIVEDTGCGKFVIHGDLEGFTETVRFFCENKTEREVMGVNARNLLMENYTVSHGYEIIMNHFI